MALKEKPPPSFILSTEERGKVAILFSLLKKIDHRTTSLQKRKETKKKTEPDYKRARHDASSPIFIH